VVGVTAGGASKEEFGGGEDTSITKNPGLGGGRGGLGGELRQGGKVIKRKKHLENRLDRNGEPNGPKAEWDK